MRRCRTEIKTRLDGMTATHNIEKFWEHMRRVHNSPRPPMTDEQRRRRPPVVHPVFLTHPITGRKVLYCNPGFAERINELPERDSDEMLEYLFAHQLQPQFRWTNVWTENDLLIWDHLGTLHRAHRRLRPGRDPADPPLPGNGDKGVRPGIPAFGA